MAPSKNVPRKASAKAPKKAAPSDPSPSDGTPTVFVAPSFIRSLAISPDGKWAATTHRNEHLTLWDARTGRACWSKRAGGAGMPSVQSAAFSPDSRLVASGSSTVKVFDVASGRPADGPAGHPKGELVDIKWSSDYIVTASAKRARGADQSVALWNPSGKLLRQWKLEIPTNVALVHGRILVSADEEPKPSLRLLDPKTGATIAAQPIESAWGQLCVNDKAVWLCAEVGKIERFDPKTLAPLDTVAIGDDLLFAVSGGAVYTGYAAEVRRRDEAGNVVAEWTVPAVAGMDEYLAALTARKLDPEVRSDETTEVGCIGVSAQGLVLVATRIAIHAYTPDGSPVRLASLGA